MILENGWKVLIFGIVLAIVTASLEGFTELTCKVSCYQFVHDQSIHNEKDRENNCYHTVVVFILNWLNDITDVWFDILTACIGWAILTPNQVTNSMDQFKWATISTFLYASFGILIQKCKMEKHRESLLQNQCFVEEKFLANYVRLRFHFCLFL